MLTHDLVTEAGGYAGPGADTRQWVSIGLVRASSPGSRSVLFEDEDGTALPYPIVLVTLQPSGIDVACRFFGHAAGAGEGQWRPFVDGDEVVVLIPQGDERQGGIIVGRGSSSRDNFPAQVAGNDPTQNNIAFDRIASPYILESAESILFRTTPTGAFLAMGKTGDFTVQSGDGHYFALTHDMLTLSTQDLSTLVQIDPSKQQVFLQAGGTQILLDSAGSSALLTAGTFAVGAGGAQPVWHVATVEGYLQFVQALMVNLGATLNAMGPVTLLANALGAVFALLGTTGLAEVIASGASTPLAPTSTKAAAAALAIGSSPASANLGCVGFLAG